ncbi:hypothetical protein [Humibacter sp.]|uniref:hypothetical protein n=1 Tax=Humibacter sp. TaxID=1940291 RepID=UPI002CF7143F|nr:hypothetical protein [Humibacter sp.]HVX09205.1 hypothetical protein [Humibacter sp.]
MNGTLSTKRAAATPTATDVRKAVRLGRVARTRVRVVLAVSAFLALFSAGPSFATSTDPTGGAGDTFFSSLTSYLQSHLIVAVLGLAVIGVIVAMILKWGGKAAKKS